LYKNTNLKNFNVPGQITGEANQNHRFIEVNIPQQILRFVKFTIRNPSPYSKWKFETTRSPISRGPLNEIRSGKSLKRKVNLSESISNKCIGSSLEEEKEQVGERIEGREGRGFSTNTAC